MDETHQPQELVDQPMDATEADSSIKLSVDQPLSSPRSSNRQHGDERDGTKKRRLPG